MRSGAQLSPETLVRILSSSGYVRAEQVEGSGQYSLRGGILDVFMPSHPNPYRIEFWGDEVDTVSEFDVMTQRRTQDAESFTITPSSELLYDDPEKLADKIEKKAASLRGKTAPLAKEIMLSEAERLRADGRLTSIDKYYSMIYEQPATLFDYFTDNELVFVSEQPVLKDRMKSVLFQWSEDLADYKKEGILCKGLEAFSEEWDYELEALSARDTVFIDNFARGSCELPLRELVNFTAKQLSLWSGSVSVLLEELDSLRPTNKTCIVLAGTAKNAENLCAELIEKGRSPALLGTDSELSGEGLYIAPGTLSASMEYPGAEFCLIAHTHSLQSSERKSRKRRRRLCRSQHPRHRKV